MSRPRLAGARSALSIALLASGAAVLSGCGASASPATTSGGMHATAAGSSTTAATGYVLTTPSSISGWKLTAPSSSTTQKLQQGLSQAEQAVGGLSGTPVTGLYDDATDQTWVVFVGLEGSFKPAQLAKAAETAPVSTTDALGDRLTTSWVTNVATGPHGGEVACQQTVEIQAGLSTYAATGLAAEGTACFWMTSSTFGVVSMQPQANRNDWDFGWNGQQMDGYMVKVRTAVEQSAS
jgi:hypothetical protein